METALGLPPEPACVDVLPEQRRRTVLVVAQSLVQHLGDGKAGVEAMKSASVRGPMGTLVPSFMAVSMSSSEASPSWSAKQASLSMGMRMRFTMKPGMSFDSTDVFPIRAARAWVAS